VKIAFISPEASPYAKASEIADFTGYLPKAIYKTDNNNEIKVILPKYKSIDNKDLNFVSQFTIPTYDGDRSGAIYSTFSEGVEFIFIEYNQYFDRKEIYGSYGNDYPDNLERFVFFSKAAIEVIKIINFKPDIIHCSSWQTALVSVFLDQFYKQDSAIRRAKRIYTIHNLSIQGQFPQDKWHITGLDRSVYVPDRLEFWGKINIKKGGLLFSDYITTISENYAKEIQLEEYGCGLEGVVRDKYDVLQGITSGVNYDIWNSETDKFTYGINYDINNLSGKEKIKEHLLRELNLDTKPAPLICFIGRYDDDSELELILSSLDKILGLNVKIIFAGNGHRRYGDQLFIYQNKNPETISVVEDFPDEYIHKILAASDMFLTSPKKGPCSPFLLYGMKYGTIPVARNLSLIKDIVKDGENGFVFDKYNSEHMMKAITKAITIYNGNKEEWITIMKNAMSKDLSWETVSKKYIELFEKLVPK